MTTKHYFIQDKKDIESFLLELWLLNISTSTNNYQVRQV